MPCLPPRHLALAVRKSLEGLCAGFRILWGRHAIPCGQGYESLGILRVGLSAHGRKADGLSASWALSRLAIA